MSEPRPQENVWEYPRPPALVVCERRVRIELGGVLLVDSTRALRVLETSHPPTIYVPPQDVDLTHITPSAARSTFCEWKGSATYFDAIVGDRTERAVAWAYPSPTPGFAALQDHLAFYPSRMDRCRLDEELVRTQEGDFYGGWITDEIVGPFKGGPGTWGW
ncbi:MAG: hypothetical protein JWM31_735 [Solirubrobacterales bacterium]|nr:hypothetical protein [Solirubrobacterales bacterium]